MKDEWKGMDVVGEGESSEKDMRLIGREFHRQGKELRMKQSENLSMEVRSGREREVVKGASFLY